MARLRRALLLPSLLARFAAVSALAVLALGAVLFHFLDASIRTRALASARQSAVLTARAVVAPHLTAAQLRRGLTPPEISALDRDHLVTRSHDHVDVRRKAAHAIRALHFEADLGIHEVSPRKREAVRSAPPGEE